MAQNPVEIRGAGTRSHAKAIALFGVAAVAVVSLGQPVLDALVAICGALWVISQMPVQIPAPLRAGQWDSKGLRLSLGGMLLLAAADVAFWIGTITDRVHWAWTGQVDTVAWGVGVLAFAVWIVPKLYPDGLRMPGMGTRVLAAGVAAAVVWAAAQGAFTANLVAGAFDEEISFRVVWPTLIGWAVLAAAGRWNPGEKTRRLIYLAGFMAAQVWFGYQGGHLEQGGDVGTTLVLFSALGLVLALPLLITGSVWPSVFMHVLWNLAAVGIGDRRGAVAGAGILFVVLAVGVWERFGRPISDLRSGRSGDEAVPGQNGVGRHCERGRNDELADTRKRYVDASTRTQGEQRGQATETA